MVQFAFLLVIAPLNILGAWSLFASETMNGTTGWKDFDVNIISSMFHFEILSPNADAKISEIAMIRGGSPGMLHRPRR